jgi:hypothetical protein
MVAKMLPTCLLLFFPREVNIPTILKCLIYDSVDLVSRVKLVSFFSSRYFFFSLSGLWDGVREEESDSHV